MAKVRQNEVLEKALSTDTSVIPRFRIKTADGTVVADFATIELLNPVAMPGMAVDKQAMDECLAASGVTGGSSTALTLAQTGFSLFDGAPVHFKLHVDSGDEPTLNTNGTGAKKLLVSKDSALPAGTPAGTWLTAIYSTTFGAYVVQGTGNSSQEPLFTKLDDLEIEVGEVTTTGWVTYEFKRCFTGKPLVIAIAGKITVASSSSAQQISALAQVQNTTGLSTQIYGPARFIAVYDGGNM